MVDMLWHDRRRLRRSGARAYNYRGAMDGVKGGKHLPTGGPTGRPRGTYIYSIRIVHDPLDCGGFAAGTEFSILEKDCMLLCGTFTVGTSLIVDGKLCFVHSSGNGGQCVKRWKPSL